MRPPPVVDRGRVVDLHPVGRAQHSTTRSGDPPQLAHRSSRIVTVLKHLRAQHDVETRVFNGQRLDGATQVSRRILDHVHPYVVGCDISEVGVIRLHAATDVQHANGRASFEVNGLGAQPVGKRRPYDPRGGRSRRIAALRSGPVRKIVAHQRSDYLWRPL